MEVPVLRQGQPCGRLWARQQGLYTEFYAQVCHGPVARLYGVFEGGEIALGIPAPEQGSMTLRASLPTSRLPSGRLLRGRLEPKAWETYPGGRVGQAELPQGLIQGDLYRFPWEPGDPLPWEPLLCFYEYIQQEGRGYLQLRLDQQGRPKLQETETQP
jgi:hypothetical protein